MTKREAAADRRGFLLGIIWSAWFLHSGHGEDTYAEELLRESADIDVLQRLACREQYHFKRGFWAEIRRRQALARG